MISPDFFEKSIRRLTTGSRPKLRRKNINERAEQNHYKRK